MASKHAILTFENVSISYGGLEVLHDVSFSLPAGNVLAIVGESGSGKSTILKAIMHLLGPHGTIDGTISYFRQNESAVNLAGQSSEESRSLYGKEIGLVFQDCLASLTPIRTIESQLRETLDAHSMLSATYTWNDAKAEAVALLKNMKVAQPEWILKSYPFELSGGLGQRTGLMISLIMKPRILLLDEPTSALDAISQTCVVNELLNYKQNEGGTMILVTHTMSLAKKLADTIIVLKDGFIQEQGSASSILNQPRSDYTKSLLSAARLLSLNDQLFLHSQTPLRDQLPLHSQEGDE